MHPLNEIFYWLFTAIACFYIYKLFKTNDRLHFVVGLLFLIFADLIAIAGKLDTLLEQSSATVLMLGENYEQ